MWKRSPQAPYSAHMMEQRPEPERQPDTDYPVLVTQRDGAFELRIWELRLVVRGSDLPSAYRELSERKKRIIDWAREVGSLDDLPAPTKPPLL